MRVRRGCGYMRVTSQSSIKTPVTHRNGQSRQPKFDLVALISECDANYARICRLFPDLGATDHWQLELPLGDRTFRVHCEVTSRDRYTCLLRITQKSFFPDMSLCEFGTPDWLVRVCFDTNCAEVVEMQRMSAFRPWTKPHRRSGQAAFEKLHVNRFFGEYLTFCARHVAASNRSLRID